MTTKTGDFVITTHDRHAEFRRAMKLMGNNFEITVVLEHPHDQHPGEEEYATAYNDRSLFAMANGHIDAAVNEIKRIEKLLTTYDEESVTNRINASAGAAPVAVPQEVFYLIERANRISRLTDGAFDLTYGSLDKSFWNFDKHMTQLPDLARAKKMVRLIDYRNIELDAESSTVFLKFKGMRLGFGGIGKGYAAEMAKTCLLQRGVKSGIINASGDLCAWGMQANNQPWTIGIADPQNANQPFSYMQLTNKAVATSGSYEKFVIINGKKYSHTINPKTGLPVSGIKSVTIITANAELADAMTTPVIIMGARNGLNLINQIPGIECIIIDDNDQIFTSNNIHLHEE